MNSTLQEVSSLYERKILELENYFSSHYENLNFESIWLFIATLGAWSITINYLRIIALIIIFYIFFARIYENRSDKRPLKKLLLSLKSEIENSELTGDARKARLYELDVIDKKFLSMKSNFMLTPKFSVCYIFWAVSFVYFSMDLVK